MSAAEIGAIAALLSMLGGGAYTIYNALQKGASSREDSLTKREAAHDETVDRKLRELADDHLRLNRKYGALLAALTVMIDHMIAQQPFDPVLATLSTTLRKAFPPEEEIPSEMAMLLLRLDGRPRVPEKNDDD